ncbi:hypothetical protein ALC57_06952 [Trachymyrmex cornetzi]|uniref:Uncharacterized protein n=1 Tax=Trachymyrmex cornetzi TaxID=471704 RepID=A0A151J869_9HYME|nr:hypothetical protein ALC57_06952 [Trachymyrmex cornetzi]
MNGERKKWKGINKGIEIREWEDYFKEFYGVEIWGWKEREAVESLQERYLRWVLGVERRTPGYLVREELQREKLRAKAGKRAWAFEERLRRGDGSREGEKLEGWEREREQYFVERGVEVDRGMRGDGEDEVNFEEIQERDREMQRVERWEKIRDSRYNRWYENGGRRKLAGSGGEDTGGGRGGGGVDEGS